MSGLVIITSVSYAVVLCWQRDFPINFVVINSYYQHQYWFNSGGHCLHLPILL